MKIMNTSKPKIKPQWRIQRQSENYEKKLNKLLAYVIATILGLTVLFLTSCTTTTENPNREVLRENCLITTDTWGSIAECAIKLDTQQDLLIEVLNKQ